MEVSLPPEFSEEKNQKLVQKRQNIILGILLFIGVSAFSLGIFQIINKIDSPFKVKGSKNNQISSLTNLPQDESLTALKNKDTDQDGLNDFDELYVYKTSPYVKDSDSDGFSDKQETDSGNDPNCPTGKVCSTSSLNSQETAVNSSSSPSSLSNSSSSQKELSAQELRDNLKKIGVAASLIDSMDDATLKDLYQKTLAETGIQPQNLMVNSPSNLQNLAPASGTTGQEITLESLQSLSASQIRDLLKQSGIEDSALKQIDDATLVKIYQQSLLEQSQSQGQ